MYLFFDTETTGLPKSWDAPVTDLDNWPRLVQLAYLFYDKDGERIAGGDFIVRPEGFTIPKSSSKIHGITNEIALSKGKILEIVLLQMEYYIKEADFLVAHNISFDEKVLGAEFLRAGMENLIPQKKKICTMKSTVDFCAIEGPYGFKYPKLSELHHKLFGVNFEEAHNAAADINATSRCFWELKRLGKI